MFAALKRLYASGGATPASAATFEDLQQQIKILRELRQEEASKPPSEARAAKLNEALSKLNAIQSQLQASASMAPPAATEAMAGDGFSEQEPKKHRTPTTAQSPTLFNQTPIDEGRTISPLVVSHVASPKATGSRVADRLASSLKNSPHMSNTYSRHSSRHSSRHGTPVLTHISNHTSPHKDVGDRRRYTSVVPGPLTSIASKANKEAPL